MHIKIIRPSKDGNNAYNNKGSARAAVEYLRHEKEELGESLLLFDQLKSDISSEDAVGIIDKNAGSMKENQTKFYSIIISPSGNELNHIENSDDRLKQYTRVVMKEYAENFSWKDGRKIDDKDLVWVAVVHENRKVKGIDLKQEDPFSRKEKEAMREGGADIRSKIETQAMKRQSNKLDPKEFLVGQNKEGNNMHVHIIVSAKDRKGILLLNPQTLKRKFHIQEFQHRGGEIFQQMFGYENSTTSKKFYETYDASQKQRIGRRVGVIVDDINQKADRNTIDKDKIIKIGEKYKFSRVFFINLNKMKGGYERGDYLRDPHFYAEHGRDKKEGEGIEKISELKGVRGHFKDESRGDELGHLSRVIGSAKSQIAIKETFLMESERKALKKYKEKGKGGDNVELE